MTVLLLLAGFFGVKAARTQTTAGVSNYIFRFNTGISAVFLDTMTFTTERPLDLGTCTTTEKIDGPIACAVNCTQDSVCLLELSGPAGATVNDVMEKVQETPVNASPSPVGVTGSGHEQHGTWFAAEGDRSAARVAAYNSVR